VYALAGGGWTGRKWMAMSGELRDGNALVASFESYSSSLHGLRMCSSVDELSEGTTDLIVDWLNSPSLGAKLK
jgi:hypothetical protein